MIVAITENFGVERSNLYAIIYHNKIFMKGLHMVTFSLLVIGGINWLLVGIVGWDIGVIFGGQSAAVSRIIYVLVGLSALVEIATHAKTCALCGKQAMSNSTMRPAM